MLRCFHNKRRYVKRRRNLIVFNQLMAVGGKQLIENNEITPTFHATTFIVKAPLFVWSLENKTAHIRLINRTDLRLGFVE
jgi:hypothetical protein